MFVLIPVWTQVTDGADGLLLTDTMVIVVSSETLTVLNLANGDVVWDASTPSTSRVTPAWATPEGLLLVGYDIGVHAFELETGVEVEPPPEAIEPAVQLVPGLPSGYEHSDGTLSYRGRRIWTGGTRAPCVARVADATIVNDFASGVSVIEDSGVVVYDPPLGQREFDSTMPAIRGGVAAVVAPDGLLHLLAVDEVAIERAQRHAFSRSGRPVPRPTPGQPGRQQGQVNSEARASVRPRSDGALPDGLPTQLVEVLRDPAFAPDAIRGSLTSSEGWSIDLGVDGDLEQVASDLSEALDRGGFDPRTISIPGSKRITFSGTGQRGRVELHLQSPLSAVISGQPDDPVAALIWAPLPPGSRPVLAETLSNPDRLEMEVVCPGTLEATVAFFEERFAAAGLNVARSSSELPMFEGGGSVAVVELRVGGPHGLGAVQLIELADGALHGAVSLLTEQSAP